MKINLTCKTVICQLFIWGYVFFTTSVMAVDLYSCSSNSGRVAINEVFTQCGGFIELYMIDSTASINNMEIC